MFVVLHRSTPNLYPSVGSVVACMSQPCVTPCAGIEGLSSAQAGPLQQGISAMLGDAVQDVSLCTDLQSLHDELREAHRSSLRLQDGTLSLIASHVRLLPALGSITLRCASAFLNSLTPHNQSPCSC